MAKQLLESEQGMTADARQMGHAISVHLTSLELQFHLKESITVYYGQCNCRSQVLNGVDSRVAQMWYRPHAVNKAQCRLVGVP